MFLFSIVLDIWGIFFYFFHFRIIICPKKFYKICFFDRNSIIYNLFQLFLNVKFCPISTFTNIENIFFGKIYETIIVRAIVRLRNIIKQTKVIKKENK